MKEDTLVPSGRLMGLDCDEVDPALIFTVVVMICGSQDGTIESSLDCLD